MSLFMTLQLDFAFASIAEPDYVCYNLMLSWEAQGHCRPISKLHDRGNEHLDSACSVCVMSHVLGIFTFTACYTTPCLIVLAHQMTSAISKLAEHSLCSSSVVICRRLPSEMWLKIAAGANKTRSLMHVRSGNLPLWYISEVHTATGIGTQE